LPTLDSKYVIHMEPDSSRNDVGTAIN